LNLSMADKPFKIRKRLKDNAECVIKPTADDLICIPRKLYLEMLSALKGQATNGGRAKNLLAELPLADKTE
jgi:hypothetical protein